MTAYQNTKIVIIGMGFLMEYIAPCYQAMVGKERLKQQVAATTVDPKIAKEQSERLGFPVQLGGSLALLREMEPDIILLSTPPAVSADVVREDVAPYCQERRDKGLSLPDLYAFPPKPTAQEYGQILGDDVAVANIIPNMFTRLGEKDISQEGRTLVTYPRSCSAWTEEKCQRVQDFFAPLGPAVLLTSEQQAAVLASFSSCRVITDILFAAEEIMGVPSSDLASCSRALFEQNWGYIPPQTQGATPAPAQAVAQDKRDLCSVLVNSWLAGIVQGMLDKGIAQDTIANTLLPLYDLRLHSLQVLQRWETERDMRHHATRGGVFECACITYTQQVAPLLRQMLKTFSRGHVSELERRVAGIRLQNCANSLYNAVLKHTLSLDERAPLLELRPEHHAALFGFIARRCVQTFGEEGRQAVLDSAARYGRERGRRMALRCQKNGEPLTMRNYLAYGEWRAAPGEADVRVVRYEPEYTTHSHKCPWCEGWIKNDLLEYGCLYCLAVDHGVVSGFNPELSIDINLLQSMGDPVCEFVWRGADIRALEDKAALDQKKKELTSQCSKDFRYHTGHLYHVFQEELENRFGAAGMEICEAARFEYRRTYGISYDFPTEGDYSKIE